MTECDFIPKSKDDDKFNLLNEKIKAKNRILYLYFFCFVCWAMAALGSLISGNTISAVLNLISMFCWGFISLMNADQISKLNKEKEEIMKKQNIKTEENQELNSLKFFSKNG